MSLSYSFRPKEHVNIRRHETMSNEMKGLDFERCVCVCDHMCVFFFFAIPQQRLFHHLNLALGQLNESTVSQ